MSEIVLDASVVLAWAFPDEGSEYADAVLVSLEGETILVPSLWAVEVTNGLAVGERRKRLREAEIRRFLALLQGLPILQDIQSPGDAMNGILPLAREYGLSAHDAAYLELAVRKGAPVATLDTGLRKAAREAGIPVYAAAG
ncbi:MAG TPA: type II toxin-antitoxin system VapC family toxin [Bryobacteraceae bacterium]|nr:type II toxin-antitoxin system VapC family toxin [Bryobacteraceae bacterium]